MSLYWKISSVAYGTSVLYLRGEQSEEGDYVDGDGGVNNGSEYSLNKVYVEDRCILPYDCSKMFYGCTFEEIVNANYLDTNNVGNMSYMFAYCYNIKSLDLSSFNTGDVTDMSYMFYNCNILEKITANFDTSRVENMSHMFDGCQRFGYGDIVSNFDTSNCTDMSYMFNECKQIDYLDLNNGDIRKVENFDSMFKNCSGLYRISSKDGADFISSSASGNNMFKNSANLPSYDSENVDMSSSFDYTETRSIPGYFNGKYPYRLNYGNINLNDEDYTINFNDESINKVYRNYKCHGGPAINVKKKSKVYGKYNDSDNYLYLRNSIPYSDYFGGNEFTKDTINDIYSYTYIKLLTDIDFSDTELTYGIFQTCRMKEFDLDDHFMYVNKNQLKCMFCQCYYLEDLDLSTLVITDSEGQDSVSCDSMFCQCLVLTSVNLNFYRSITTNNIRTMFMQCPKLTSINLSKFNFVYDSTIEESIQCAFGSCNYLQHIYINQNLNNWKGINTFVDDTNLHNYSKVKDASQTYAIIDDGTNNGYFESPTE